MKILACLGFFVMLFWHSTSGSRITFQAIPDKILSTVTKSLKLRCAVELYDLQAQDMAMKADSGMAKQARNTTEAISTLPPWTTSITQAPSITQAEVSHITSIIVSRIDVTTGKHQEVATLSLFALPVAHTDLDKIKVEGQATSSPVPGELGYLQISWMYPIREQATTYTCEVYGLDSSQHPVSLTKSVEVKSVEPSVSELTTIISQNDKSIDDLQQTVSNLTVKISNMADILSTLASQNSAAIEDLYNITKELRNETQIIQIGTVTCGNNGVSSYKNFTKPFKNIPQVFFPTRGLSSSGTYATGTIALTTPTITLTQFLYTCTYSGIYSITDITWIAIGN